MSLDSDVALVGTGVAPLVAAMRLLAQGKSVLLLNPDHDFFLEESELPLDPILPRSSIGAAQVAQRLAEGLPDRALEALRPEFPGAVEFWSGAPSTGFRDPLAPHLRQRARLWLSNGVDSAVAGAREFLEALYVECSDRGLKPQILEDLQALRRFPGFSGQTGEAYGLLVPRSCDVDVSRYRYGLLEYMRERLGAGRVVCAANQLELMQGGLRFHAGGSGRTARLREGMLVFWTPRLSRWVFEQSKRGQVEPGGPGEKNGPKGIRFWEQWTLMSRDPIDHSVVGVCEDMAFWGEVEGAPSAPAAPAASVDKEMNRLSVLIPGEWTGAEWLKESLVSQPIGSGVEWASAESFNSIRKLCTGFMKWERVSIRGMKPRAIFEWEENAAPWKLSELDTRAYVVPRSDGPLFSVVAAAREACRIFAEGSGA